MDYVIAIVTSMCLGQSFAHSGLCLRAFTEDHYDSPAKCAGAVSVLEQHLEAARHYFHAPKERKDLQWAYRCVPMGDALAYRPYVNAPQARGIP